MVNLAKGSLAFVKGVVIALIFSLISVLIFALVIELFSLPLTAIKPVNCILKIIAVCLGTLFAVREDKGLIKGVISGILISFFTFLLFGTISGEINFSLPLLWELLLGGAVGSIVGIVAVAIKR